MVKWSPAKEEMLGSCHVAAVQPEPAELYLLSLGASQHALSLERALVDRNSYVNFKNTWEGIVHFKNQYFDPNNEDFSANEIYFFISKSG
jgi:hypothetical protein